MDEKKDEASTPKVEAELRKRKTSNSYAVLRAQLMKVNPIKNHFSSTPIDPETNSSISESTSGLTESERTYLEKLLEKGDPNLIERASQRLCDPMIFPPLNCATSCTAPPKETAEAATLSATTNTMTTASSSTTTSCSVKAAADVTAQAASAASAALAQTNNRDSQLQQELFRIHETQAVPPSRLLRRLSLVHKNSILEATTGVQDLSRRAGEDVEDDLLEQKSSELEKPWDPFKDVASWLDGSQGVEVTGRGVPISKDCAIPGHVQQPFRILGTAADDVSCHPHVLSPPLMESLLAFVPEGLAQSNFWLKYSLVRDGPSLWTFLRQVRASDHTFIAIETMDGHVFGSFTCQSWRLAQGWYGNQSQLKDSFLWKMRRSRLETTCSIVEQACQEAEIQVFPYREGNVAVQYCSKDHLMLGQGELHMPTAKMLGGKHFGHGLYVDASFASGTTSNCETFGNPCLVDAESRGARFDISNFEVWTLTPHQKVREAEQSELSTMFLEGAGVDNLNIMKILVGGSI